MNKRGFEMSFGFIFSMILIAVIVFSGFYAIGKFVGVKKCTENALFYEELQDFVDRIWRAEIAKETFQARVNGIEKVCIGNLTEATSQPEYEELNVFRNQEGNTYLYPPEKACENLRFKNIRRISFDYTGINCFTVREGKVTIDVEKDIYDSSVTILRGD